jgi:hypothetical protein
MKWRHQSHTRLFFKRLGEWASYSVPSRNSHLSDSVNSALSPPVTLSTTLSDSQSYTHWNRHLCTLKNMYIYTHSTLTLTYTSTSHTQSHTHINSHIHTLTHILSHNQSHPLNHIKTLIHMYSHRHTNTQTHRNPHTYTHKTTYTHPPPTHTHTHLHIHTPKQTASHTGFSWLAKCLMPPRIWSTLMTVVLADPCMETIHYINITY